MSKNATVTLKNLKVGFTSIGATSPKILKFGQSMNVFLDKNDVQTKAFQNYLQKVSKSAFDQYNLVEKVEERPTEIANAVRESKTEKGNFEITFPLIEKREVKRDEKEREALMDAVNDKIYELKNKIKAFEKEDKDTKVLEEEMEVLKKERSEVSKEKDIIDAPKFGKNHVIDIYYIDENTGEKVSTYEHENETKNVYPHGGSEKYAGDVVDVTFEIIPRVGVKSKKVYTDFKLLVCKIVERGFKGSNRYVPDIKSEVGDFSLEDFANDLGNITTGKESETEVKKVEDTPKKAETKKETKKETKADKPKVEEKTEEIFADLLAGLGE